MYSFLGEIRDTMIENKSIITNVFLDRNCFPEYFNLFIWNKLHEIGGDSCLDKDIDGYNFVHPLGTEVVYLTVESKTEGCNAKIAIVLSEEDSPLVDEGYTILVEKSLVKQVNRMMKKLLNYFNGCVRSREVLKDYNWDTRNMEDQLKDSAKKCINAIMNADNSYKKKLYDYVVENFEEIFYARRDSIFHKAVEGDTRSRGKIKFNERVHEIIEYAERFKILAKYPYLHTVHAECYAGNESNYLCFLYQIDTGRYALVLEPFTGISYTQVVIFDSENEISRSEFLWKVRYYLSMSYEEGLERSEIIRLGHTTIDAFEAKIRHIIDSKKVLNNGVLADRSFRRRTRDLIDLKRNTGEEG